MRHLVEHSVTAGTLDRRYYRHLKDALEVEHLTIAGIVSRTAGWSSVAADDGVADIQRQTLATQHRRILVSGDDQTVAGVVHVRDTLRADAGCTAGDLMRPVLQLSSDTPVYRALHIMRQTRNHLAMV